MSEPPPAPPSHFLRLAVPFEGGLGLLALPLGWLVGRSPWGEIVWNWSAAAEGLTAAALMLIGLAVILRSPAGWCVRLRQLVDEFVTPLFANCRLFELALIALLAGFGEELMFRGLIQATLGQWFSPTAGLIGASLLFGLAHPLSASYTLLTTLAGLFFGGLWLWSGNLLAPIVAHAAYDFLALVYLMRRRRSARLSQSV